MSQRAEVSVVIKVVFNYSKLNAVKNIIFFLK